MEREIVPGLYRHFKGKYYLVHNIVTHSETKEPLVWYKALYEDYKDYVRPLKMFSSDVDHEKYPEVEQKERFKLISTSFEESMFNLDEEGGGFRNV